MSQIGRLRQVGLGKESTAGTAVNPVYWIPVESGKVIPDVAYEEDGGTVGRIEAPFQSEPVKENCITQFECVARSDFMGYLLLAAFGTVSSATAGGESAVYEHSFTVQNDNDHDSFTVVVKDGIGTEGSPYSMLNTLSFNCDAAGLLRAEAEFVGKQLESDSGTPSYTTDKVWLGKDGTIKIASAISGLSGASAIGFNKMSLTIEKGLVQHHEFGSITLASQHNTALRVSGELELLYENTTYRDYVTDGSEQAMQISFQNPTTIGNAEKPEVHFQLAKCSFEEFDVNDSNDDLVIQTLGFKAQYDIDEGTPQMMNCVLTNEVASY